MLKGKKKIMPIVLIVVILISLFSYLYKNYSKEKVYVSRAEAAKVLAISMYSMQQCSELEIVETKDIKKDMWCAPYVTAVLSKWVMVTDDGYFYPLKMLTYNDVKLAVEKLNINTENLSFSLEKQKDDQFILKQQWLEIIQAFNQSLDVLDYKKVTIEATSATDNSLKPWTCKTSEGILGFTGLVLDPYVGKIVEMWIRDGEIGAVGYVVEESEESKESVSQESNLQETEESQIIQVMAENIAVSSNIRVMLNTTGYGGLIHEGVSVSSPGGLTLTWGEETLYYEPEVIVDISSGDGRFSSGNPVIYATDGTVVRVNSISRSSGNPVYRGQIEVVQGDGGLYLINQLPLEEYLYGVLPSEMPVSYGLESLKVQAVCARSFAIKSLEEPKYPQYNGHLDDSTSCQVYLNSAEDPLAIQAVNETAGQVIMDENQGIVTTYFYSTSCGITSDVTDVWGGEIDYLRPMLLSTDLTTTVMVDGAQNIGTVAADAAVSAGLQDEMTFRDFIDLKTGDNYYEKDYGWFRWEVPLTSNNLVNGVAQVLGNYKSGTIGGTVTGIEVGQRGSSGIATEITIYSQEGTAKIYGEYSIRKALSVSGQTITCHNGQTVTNQTMLPSGYFYVYSNGANFIAKGGGFGHGVGMSQNGAAAMCANGMSYDTVLACFYLGTHIGHVDYK